MRNDEKINILLVDDKEENLLALEAIIDRDDYRLVKASSGEEALKCLLKNDFAAILLDVQMPGMDGFGTAKIIKAREKTKNIPILFITANNFDSDHIFMGYSLGAIDYILKPFDPFILKAKVDGFVDIYRMKQKLIKQAEALAEKNKMIEYMAFHDSLTDLPNRRYFNKKLNDILLKSKQAFQSFTIMYLDMDHFKYINDSLGHLIGDRVLQEVGKSLAGAVRESDFVARTGGDEFNIILPNTNREMALEIAEKLLDVINETFYIDSYELFITACIGISVFPYDGEDSTVLMKNADAALYRAKEQGRNLYKVFHSGMNIQTYRAFALKNDLRKALERQEFEIVYEPRIGAGNGIVTSAQASLRWNHPNWGTIYPMEFIPLAEEIGLMVAVDEWSLKTVCSHIKLWEEAGIPTIPIAMNLSKQQFLQKDMMANILHIISTTAVSPSLLEFEMPEGVILANESIINSVICQLREIGIKITISNFGLGYTTLNYLKSHPVDKLKIDKSFVHFTTLMYSNHPPLIATVISLAESLQMSVIADGIENEEQWKVVRELNCQEFQGLLISPPVLPNDFQIFIEKNNEEAFFNNNATISYINSEKAVLNKKIKTNHIADADIDVNQNEEILRAALTRVKETYSISTREMDVFTLIVNGLNNRKISEELFISEHTVKNHITSILQKLGVNDRLQAMAIVYQACLEEGKNLSGLRKKSM